MQRRAVLSLLGLPALQLLTACATSKSVDDGSPIKPGQGVLALKAISNVYAEIDYVTFERTESYASSLAERWVGPKGSLAFEKGEKFLVLPVDAGEYMWSKISIYPKEARLRNSNRFVVKANAINYIGHLQVHSASDRVQIQAQDRTDDMRAHLEQKFPKFLKSMAFEKELAQLRL